MSDVINGVPRELLEFIAANARGVEREKMDRLRALLTAQPQSSATQSAPDEREFRAELEAARGLLERAATCMRDSAFIIDSSSYRINGAAAAVYSLRSIAVEITATLAQPAARKVYGCPRCGTGMEVDESAKPAAQGQGEVQRMREALNRIRDHAARVMDDEVFYEADIALNGAVASTGQEV